MSMHLPDAAGLLLTGGDTRIVLDPYTGRTVYGCRNAPEPEKIALGSSTASTISMFGMAAAQALRDQMDADLQHASAHAVYSRHALSLQQELLKLCGVEGMGVEAVLSASGTDLHLLLAQWLQPDCTVMVTSSETGSGVSLAMRGRHFNGCSSVGGAVAHGALLSAWQGDLHEVDIRNGDGTVRDIDERDAEYLAAAEARLQSGQSVLLILTDGTKTGLLAPGIATIRTLQQRWPEQVDVLVDACQFRLAQSTLQAYLALGWMVAVTGSKFLCGPTFSGALLVPSEVARRYRERRLPIEAGQYSDAANWPNGWQVAKALPDAVNFGMLLRWQAALAGLRAFREVPQESVRAYLQMFGQAVREQLLHDVAFSMLPVAARDRSALVSDALWDSEQTIFPFLIRTPPARQWLPRAACEALYKTVRDGDGKATDETAQCFQLGQPVHCGERDGVAVSALRICIGADMVVRAAASEAAAHQTVTDAINALQRIRHLAGW